MQIKALLLCVAVAAALNVNLAAAEQPGVPRGWAVTPDTARHFETGFEPTQSAAYLRAKGDAGDAVGVLYQGTRLEPGETRLQMKLEAETLSDSNTRSAMMFMRCRGAAGKPMSMAPIKVDQGWTNLKISMVADKRQSLHDCDFGVALRGQGQVWLRNVRFTVADPDPDHPSQRLPLPNLRDLPVPPLNAQPTNLELRP